MSAPSWVHDPTLGHIAKSGAVAVAARALGLYLVGNESSALDTTSSMGILQTDIEVVDLTAGVVTTFNIPSGALLLGAQFNVDTAVTDSAGDDTWSAAWSGGGSGSLASGAAAAQNTKVSTISPAWEVSSSVTNITFTPNGGSFTAGDIAVRGFYVAFADLRDA